MGLCTHYEPLAIVIVFWDLDNVHHMVDKQLPNSISLTIIDF